MQANYARCLANTLVEEGGWTNDPRDPGGPTMRGIIQREYDRYRDARGLPRQSVRFISEGELQAIYAGNYWKPMRGDLWPKGSDQIVFDIAVNSGTVRAPQIMGAAMGTSERNPAQLAVMAQRSGDRVGIVKRACARRAGFYRALRTFSAFGRGWLRRNARMEAIGVRMVLEAEGGVRPGALEREKTAAQAKAKRAGQGATGTAGGGAAGGGALTQTDASAWDWSAWLLVGAGAVAAIALVVFLVWLWRKHGERAKAYAAAIAGTLEADLDTVLGRIKGASA